MATLYSPSSRSKAPPQLPPIRPLSVYSTQLATTMALTGLDVTNVSAHPAGTGLTSPLPQKIDLDRPLPRPPAMSSSQPPQPPSQLRHSALSAHNQRVTIDLHDVAQPSTRPRKTSAYRPASYFWGSNDESTFLATLDVPRILHSVLAELDWHDAYALFTTCKKLCNAFLVVPLRDVILARYVPGYAQCLRDRDAQFYQDVPVSLHDLDRLLISQRVGLHRYPIHALRMLQSLYPSLEDDQLRNKFASLAQAHSRFVLLLQAMVHSSSASIPQESEDSLGGGAYRPRFSPIQTLRELTFPAPLAYSEPPQVPSTRTSMDPSPRSKSKKANAGKMSKHSRHRSAPTTPSAVQHELPSPRTWSLDLPRSPRPSADATSTMISTGQMKKGRKLSVFGRKASRAMTPPPPPDEPRALKMYASTWRKSTMYPLDAREDGVLLNDLKRFKIGARHPTTRSSFFNDSSDSSSLSVSRSRNSLNANGNYNHNHHNSDPKSSNSPSLPTSHHDLIHATSRIRAPILRVFVPCTQLDAGSESLAQCEQQLVASGLWSHLSTGDIVCNLGYVPSIEPSTPPEGNEPSQLGGEFIIMRPGSASRRSSPFGSGPGSPGGSTTAAGTNAGQKWLIFNGQMLVPYVVPEVIPLAEPLNLPTPFYYAHIMPPFANPSFVIHRLPPVGQHPQLVLIHSSKKVPSPHSPNGWAMVRKYAWTARVVRTRTEADHETGDGWFGEWVLEGEGTPEGKQLLMNALMGWDLGYREWELVREKSGVGRLWLRLLTI